MHLIPLNSLVILLPGVLSNPVDLEKIWGKHVTKDFHIDQGVSHQMVLKVISIADDSKRMELPNGKISEHTRSNPQKPNMNSQEDKTYHGKVTDTQSVTPPMGD